MALPSSFAVVQLTPRDIQILLMVYHYDGLVNQQLRRRFWADSGTPRHCYKRVEQLITAGYLKACRLPSATRSGSGPTWLTIGPAAIPILKEYLRLTHAEIKQLRHTGLPVAWQHEVIGRDIRLALELACLGSADTVTLTEWITDSELKRTPIKISAEGQKTLELVPDAIFTLEVAGQAKRHYLENDRSTMVGPTRFKQRLAAYLLHIGVEPTPVLLVVPDQRRRVQLGRWIQEEAARLAHSPTMFGLALQTDLNEQTILTGRVWGAADGRTSFSLVPPGTGSSERHQPAPRVESVTASQSWFQRLLARTEGQS